METYINEQIPIITEEKEPKTQEIMVKKVLIATLFNPEPVLLASTRLGPEKIILLVSKDTTKEQEASIKLIQESLGKVIDIKIVKIELYDIVDVAKKVVEIIDLENIDNEIYVNLTSGRKTQSIGLLFACYARHERVKKIAYNPEEDKTSIVYLPKISFNLTENQKKVLIELEKKRYDSISDLAARLDQSTAMVYRNIEELRDMDLVSTEKGIEITDAGRIARL